MPSLGADMEAGTLVTWKRKPGDHVEKGEIIAEVETDKGLIEIEVFETGIIETLLVPEGTKVPVGTPLARIQPATATSPRAEGEPAAEQRDAPKGVRGPPLEGEPGEEGAGPRGADRREATAKRHPTSPSARQLARERGVDLGRVRGTGRHGTITREDVLKAGPGPRAGRLRISPYARRRASELGVDSAEASGTGPAGAVQAADVERLAAERPRAAEPVSPRQRMRQAIAAAMARSKREIPHYYLSATVDLGPATEWLAARNEGRPPAQRVLPAALHLKAVALALRRVPELNARFEGDAAPPLEDVHVGVAVSLRGGGLVAPAIHHTDRQDVDDLMRALGDLVQRARAGTLRGSEMSDGTITVTSLGDRGVETVFPVIYPPQVAIVGFGKVVQRPWVVDGRVEPRPTVVATLAADHRVSDGHRGGLFLAAVEELLTHPEKL